jgi:hypothetical protein
LKEVEKQMKTKYGSLQKATWEKKTLLSIWSCTKINRTPCEEKQWKYLPKREEKKHWAPC